MPLDTTGSRGSADSGDYTSRTPCGGDSPLRAFLRTETGSTAVLLAGAVAALMWANAAPGTNTSFWETPFSLRVGSYGISLDLRTWVNSGLMTLFSFVVGLEARREFDRGELRERRRLALPLAAGAGGMAVPVALFLALNAGQRDGCGLGRGDVHRHRVRAGAAPACRPRCGCSSS
ncbi:Na+/H+ antiporter NhaA [Streptomyces sp. NPDC055051]